MKLFSYITYINKQLKMTKEKQFAQHPTHTSYYATTSGEIISFKGKQPRFIIQCNHGRGYTQFLVSNGRGNVKSYLSHRFIYECFYGLIDDDTLQVHHIDHDKVNNALSNLALVTDWENKMHAKNAGRKTGAAMHKKNKKK
jgi:hypothetical protein